MNQVKNNSNKLVLGTVQFGLDYGVNNFKGIPSDDELIQIFNLAKNSGIDMLDSAPSYGNSEQRIGQLASNSFNVVSKFSLVSKQLDLMLSLQRSLKNLNTNQIYGFIAHNADELLKFPQIWEWLKIEQEKGLIEKIGYSLYQPEQLKELLRIGMIPNLVQLPYNLLDRKFKIYLNKLKDLGCEIHIRTVFLQGLFFKDTQTLNQKLKPLLPEILIIHKICEMNKISMSELALGFVNNNPFIDKIVIGVDDSNQLSNNILDINSNKINDEIMNQLIDVKVKNQELLNPSNW